jgi:hypothetical protein
MKMMTELKVGEKYLVDGYPATVVAIPATRTFDPKFPAEEWLAVWPTGIVVEDDQAGLIYYPDLEGLRIEPIMP